MILSLNYISFIFVHQFLLPHFVQILPLLVNGKRIKNGGQAYGFSCNYFYEDCPLAEDDHHPLYIASIILGMSGNPQLEFPFLILSMFGNMSSLSF